MKKDNFVESEQYLIESLEIDEEIGNVAGITYRNKTLGELYLQTGKLERSLNHLMYAYELAQDLEYHVEIVEILIKLGRVYHHLDNSERATFYLREAYTSNSKLEKSEYTGEIVYYLLQEMDPDSSEFQEIYLSYLHQKPEVDLIYFLIELRYRPIDFFSSSDLPELISSVVTIFNSPSARESLRIHAGLLLIWSSFIHRSALIPSGGEIIEKLQYLPNPQLTSSLSMLKQLVVELQEEELVLISQVHTPDGQNSTLLDWGELFQSSIKRSTYQKLNLLKELIEYIMRKA